MGVYSNREDTSGKFMMNFSLLRISLAMEEAHGPRSFTLAIFVILQIFRSSVSSLDKREDDGRYTLLPDKQLKLSHDTKRWSRRQLAMLKSSREYYRRMRSSMWSNSELPDSKRAIGLLMIRLPLCLLRLYSLIAKDLLRYRLSLWEVRLRHRLHILRWIITRQNLLLQGRGPHHLHQRILGGDDVSEAHPFRGESSVFGNDARDDGYRSISVKCESKMVDLLWETLIVSLISGRLVLSKITAGVSWRRSHGEGVMEKSLMGSLYFV
jgi:hypothetical protein